MYIYIFIAVITQLSVYSNLFVKELLQDNTSNFAVQVSSKPDVLSPKTVIPVRKRSIEGLKIAAAVGPPPHVEADLCLDFYGVSFGLNASSRFKKCWTCKRTALRSNSSRHTLRSCQE